MPEPVPRSHARDHLQPTAVLASAAPLRGAESFSDLGGAKGTRTPGLLHAMQALYQLSYSPAYAAELSGNATLVYKI